MIKASIFNSWRQTKIDRLLKKDRQGYILDPDAEQPKKNARKASRATFLARRIRIRQVEKIVANLKDLLYTCTTHQNLNQALKHGFKMKKVHRVIRSEQS